MRLCWRPPVATTGCVRCFRPGQQQLVFAPSACAALAADEVRSVPDSTEPALSLIVKPAEDIAFRWLTR